MHTSPSTSVPAGSAYCSGPPDALGDDTCTPLIATPTPPTTVACFGVALNTVVRGIEYVVVVGVSVLANELRLGLGQSMRYCGTLLLVTLMVVAVQLTVSVGSV